MKLIIEESLYSALKSLFRYNKLSEMKAPDILIDNETQIMKDRFSKLTMPQLYKAFLIWPEFLKEQSVEDELQNIELEADLARFMSSN